MGWLLKHSWFPQINQVILVIVMAEFVLTVAFGLLAPIFAVFVTQQIIGGSVAVVGFAITIYWTVKSVLQLGVAKYIDRNHGEVDDFYFFLAGGFLNAVVISLYYFATTVWHIYTLHFFMAIADAMLVPPFYAIFTRHIDKKEEGLEWSLYYTATDLGAALTAGLGGLLAATFGYRSLFVIVGFASLAGAAFLAGVTRKLKGHKIALKKIEIPLAV